MTVDSEWANGRPTRKPEPSFETSEQGRFGAALLAQRKRAPKAPLSKLHDRMLGRSK